MCVYVRQLFQTMLTLRRILNCNARSTYTLPISPQGKTHTVQRSGIVRSPVLFWDPVLAD